MHDQDPTLPLEIIEKIIKELWRNRRTLKTCTRVSKAFCELSQRHLFRTIKISEQRHIPFLWHAFQQSPRLVSFVRFLALDTIFPYQGDQIALDRLDPNLSVLLRTFTRIQSLAINCQVLWAEMPADLKASFRTLFSLPSLTHLKIDKGVNFPASVLFKPQLTYFHWRLDNGEDNQFCDDDDPDADVAPASDASPAPPPKQIMKTFVLQFRMSEWVYNWLMHPQCPIDINHLDALHLHVNLGIRGSTIYLPLKILQTIAHPITLLHLDVNVEAWSQETIDLSQLSRLRELYIRFDAWLEQITPYNPIGWLNQTLRTLPLENQIEKIGFQCDIVKEFNDSDRNDYEDEEILMLQNDLPWADLDQILTRPGNRKLRTVLWRVNEDIKSILLVSLPTSRQRGLLTFVDSEETYIPGPMSLGDPLFGF